MEKKKTSTKKEIVKKPTKKVTKKVQKKKKKAFTLIELLAVIIILGILMIIAIPSVTKYISDSRKNAYISTAKEIISSTRNLINEGKLEVFDTGVTYYLPISCINTENALKSPYAEFEKAYVAVTYHGSGYNYYFMSVDKANIGIKTLVSADKLSVDDIEEDIPFSEVNPNIGADGKGSIVVFGEKCASKGSPEPATTMLDEGGSNGGGGTKTAAQQISEVQGLVNIAGAKRYVGPNPSNYVSFNNGELWRIIGVYGNQLKIIKSTYLERRSLNSSGSIAFQSSSLQSYLNDTYYNTIEANSRNMIDENASWYVGNAQNNLTPPNAYNNTKSKSITSKVGLIATYEFLYATNDDNCYNTQGDSYYSNSCGTSTKNWLVARSYDAWTLTPHYYDAEETRGTPLNITQSGYVSYGSSQYSSMGIYPVVYLNPSVKITGGSGTSTDPYTLSM